jgi:hypothetical protein
VAAFFGTAVAFLKIVAGRLQPKVKNPLQTLKRCKINYLVGLRVSQVVSAFHFEG